MGLVGPFRLGQGAGEHALADAADGVVCGQSRGSCPVMSVILSVLSIAKGSAPATAGALP